MLLLGGEGWLVMGEVRARWWAWGGCLGGCLVGGLGWEAVEDSVGVGLVVKAGEVEIGLAVKAGTSWDVMCVVVVRFLSMALYGGNEMGLGLGLGNGISVWRLVFGVRREA